MKAKHHFWSSLVAGGALYWVTGSSVALAGSMLGGFFIDSDHVIDQLWSIVKGAPLMKESASNKAGERIRAGGSRVTCGGENLCDCP